MPEPAYSDDILILTARLYYIDNLPQAQIAQLTNVSQSKVSRMLSLARERGLVRVTVPEYETRHHALECEFQKKLGVRAVVIRMAAGLRPADFRHSLGYFAAPTVSQWIESKDVVAIAGGRTMQALVEHMRPPTPRHSVTIVQAMGNIDSSPGPYDAVELGRALASRWQGTFLTLNIPAILPDRDTCRQFLALHQISEVVARLAESTIAFAGVGTLENSVFVERKILHGVHIEALRKAGAVGEMLGRFYDSKGNECATDYRERVVSLPLNKLRKVAQIVAVVSGADRSTAVLAGIRGGLIKSLVMDESGAAAVLEKAR